MTKENIKVAVEYECVDGMHFFTPGDAATRGLCAGNVDLKKAFDAVSVQLPHLLEVNWGYSKAEAEVEPGADFDEFCKQVTLLVELSSSSDQIIPHAKLKWSTKKETE